MSVSVGARPAFNVLPTKSFDLLLTVMATLPLMGANPPLGRLQVVDGLQGDGVGCEQPMVQMHTALSVRVCRSVDAGGRPAPLLTLQLFLHSLNIFISPISNSLFPNLDGPGCCNLSLPNPGSKR